MTFVQATSVDHLKPIIEAHPEIFDDSEKQARLYSDFSNRFFQAHFYLKDTHSCISSIHSIQAYALTYFSYSAWQHRVISIADLWYDPNLTEQARLEVFARLRDELFVQARKHKCKRINYSIDVKSESNKKLVGYLEEMGMRNLTREEDWNIFELGTNELDEFVKDVPSLEGTRYKIVKIEDISRYADQLHKCIYELAVYEKCEDQFECTVKGIF